MNSEITQLVLSEKPIVEGDEFPQVVIGFTHMAFSQAVYLRAPSDPQEAVKVADALYKGYIQACAASIKAWEDRDAQSAGAEVAAGSCEEAFDGQA